MRNVVVQEFLTLDGVMQGPGSPDEDTEGGFDLGGWHNQFFDEVQMKVAGEGIARAGAYLFGRRTYQIFARYWPHQPDSDPFAATLNGLPKYIVSTTLDEPLEWRNSTLLKGNPAQSVAELKQEDGKDIVVLGSGKLVRTLLANDLVDELGLMIDPIILGKGKRLFDGGLSPTKLELADAKTTTTGVQMLTYRRATG